MTPLAAIQRAAEQVFPEAVDEAVVRFADPEGTSKRSACEFNRDRGWDAPSAAGFRPVRQVAIDKDWSALRFRRAADPPA